jgi:hypothetical protein
MGKKTTSVVGTVAVLAAGPVLAAPVLPQEPAVPVATSYAELLQPIPNAVERLKLADAEAARRPARVVPVQYHDHHHHHHHHHHHTRAWYRSHGYYWSGNVWVLRPVPHHHHHHHHAQDNR